MPSTPTTKSQVQAYRFVLRRMESALVRKDPVMLHDPMRTHKRSTVVGAILGVVGLVGFLVYALLNQSPNVPTKGIVIANPSGTIYVVSQNPHELIPVFNLASARLLLAANQLTQQQNANGSQAGAGQGPEVPVVVTDDQVKGLPLGRLTGIPDGPTVLPSPTSATTWALCDNLPRDTAALNQVASDKPPTTTAMVGQPNIGDTLTDTQALLVSSDGGRTLYLVYGLTGDINHPDDSAVRAEVDKNDRQLMAALGIDSLTPRRISVALLNAIPQVGKLQNPANGLDTSQQAAGALAANGLSVGQSFKVQALGSGAPPVYYMAVPGGKQQVSETVALIAQYENSGGQAGIRSVPPDEAGPVHDSTTGLQVNTTEYPGKLPVVIAADAKPTTCLGWAADFKDPQKPLYKTRVAVDVAVELPADKDGPNGRMMPVPIGQGGPGGKIDAFAMLPGMGGAVIRAASSAKEFGSGPIYVVDPRGVKFSVPNLQTANVLGITDGSDSGGIPPAPEPIVGLLPNGAQALDVQSVLHSFDAMPMPANAGQYITPPNQSSGGN